MTSNLDEKGLRSIVGKYDVFFIDIWGVLHNGLNLFQNSVEVLENLEKNKKSVLFVCIHNSARSQMAEAFLKTLSKDFFVNSAGISPGKLNPLVVKSMMEIGIDISNNKTKSVESVLKKKQKYDYFIFVCSESQGQECPYIPYKTKKIYWDINDEFKYLNGNY